MLSSSIATSNGSIVDPTAKPPLPKPPVSFACLLGLPFRVPQTYANRNSGTLSNLEASRQYRLLKYVVWGGGRLIPFSVR